MIKENIDGGISYDQKLELSLDSGILLLILVKYIFNLCLNKQIGFGLQILWIIVELVAV
jgi:hypothetical protein